MSSRDEYTVSLAPVYTIWQENDRYRQQGRINSTWKSVIDNDTLLKEVKMVIDIRIGGEDGGKQLRISCQPVDLLKVSGNGGLHAYSAVPLIEAEPEIKNVYTVGNPTSAARSLSLTINPSLIDPASLIEKGLFLCGFAEVSLAIDGLDWAQRHVIIRGDLSGGVSFGGRTKDGQFSTMDFEVVDPRQTVASKLPIWVMDIGRFNSLFSGALGQVYPVIVNGYPHVPCIRTTGAPTGGNKFVVCHGLVDQVLVTETSVNGVYKAPGDADYPHNIQGDNDNYGVWFTEIAFTGPVTTEWSDSDSVYCRVEKPDQNLSIIGCIREILERYTSFGISGLEPILFSDAEAKIPFGLGDPQICINGSGANNSATGISYIEGGLLESYPMISMIWEKGGYGPIVTDFRSVAQTKFVAGQHPLFDRSSLVQESDKAKICNDFIIRYNYNAMLDQYESVLIRSPNNSTICAYSREMFGYRGGEQIESNTIFDDATAAYVLDWMVAHKALPSYYVEYEGSPTLFFKMRRGDTIEITDQEFGWDEEKATIEKLTYRSGKTIIGLRVWFRYIEYGGEAYTIGASPSGNPGSQADSGVLPGNGNIGGGNQGGNQGGGQQPVERSVRRVNSELSPFQVELSDDIIVVDGEGDIIILLPDAEPGKVLNIKASPQTNAQSPITISPPEGKVIDGEAQFGLTFSSSAITLVSDINGWLIL